MDVLQLDISGRPQAWITPREAAVLYACDAIAWTLGDTFQVLRGARPPLDGDALPGGLPASVATLLGMLWAAQPRDRPTAVQAVAVACSTAGAVPAVRAAPAVPAVVTVAPVVRAEPRARLHCGAKVVPVVPVA
jgi:hypothetical protein